MNMLLTSCRRSVAIRVAAVASLFPSLVFLPTSLQANPENGVVVAGMAEIGEGLDGHLAITQGTDRAIINWESFSIAAGELTQFLQPGADSAVLNRVIADNPSAIHGALQANGKVFLINPAGIMVGPTGAIDVNGFVASTLDVPDASFMAGGDMIFSGSSENGVSNFGRINAVGGDVFLIGKSVVNAGSISAREGTVGLAAGSEVLITAQANAGGERVFVRPGPGSGSGTGIENSGSIEGAAVELKAHGNMYAMAINNSGTIRATGSSTGSGGKVFLTAAGGRIDNSGSIRASLPSGAGGSIFINAGKGGLVNAGGEINADGVGRGSKGGNVVVLGEEIAVLGGASISANGDAGGGTIVIGGGANPLTDDEDEGDGGNVESSKITVAAGSSISANGANGPGGIIVIAGSDTSTVSVGGSVSATGGGSSDGGMIFLGGGDVTTTETSVIDASGGINGGTITIQGETSATVNGGVRAVGNSGDGGVIMIEGGDQASVGPNAVIDASGGTNGGIITVNSPDGTTDFNGTALATGGSGDGGIITVTGTEGVTVGNTGVLDASGGTNGGIINVASENGNATFNGSALATGGSGQGGQISVTGDQGVTVGNGALLDASGGSAGGIIVVDGMNGVTSFDGTARAVSANGAGGRIDVTGKSLIGGSNMNLDASGATGGGTVHVGGGFQGQDASVSNSWTTLVGNGAQLTANATSVGAGGNVVVWGDIITQFNGMISAQGNLAGGSAEVSGKYILGFGGLVNLSSTNGTSGTLLLDPTDVIIEFGGGVDSDALANTLDTGTSINITTNPAGGAGLGNITIRSNVEWYQDSAAIAPGTLGLFAHNNILFADDVRSAGTGGINIVAGWDGVDTDMAAILLSMNDGNAGNDRAGLNGGSVFINGYTIAGSANDGAGDRGPTTEFAPNQREGIEVGSRFGATQIAAHDLRIRGKDGSNSGSNSDRYWAQVGFRDTGTEYQIGFTSNRERNEWWGSDAAADGSGTGFTAAGNAQGKDYITMLGGTHVAGGAFLGAGHGATGDITVQVSGKVELRGGNDGHSYAMIGHGGSAAEGLEDGRDSGNNGPDEYTTRDGFVMDPGTDDRTFFGTSWRTNYINNANAITLSNGDMIDARVNANITIEAGEHFFAMAPQNMEGTADGGGFFDLSDDQGSSSRWVKVGHGGQDNYGSYHGDISVITHGATVAGTGQNNFGLAGAGIQLRGGRGTLNSATIGHGGFHEGNARTIYDQTASGDITVRANGGAVRLLGFNLLPRQGDDNRGAVAAPTVQSTDTGSGDETQFSDVQIGHGGWHRDDAATGGLFTAGGAATGTAILNAGQPHQNMQGDIEVYAGGTVSVLDHMGYNAAGDWVEDLGPGHDPYDRNNAANNIARNVGIEVRAGNNEHASGRIGHGGHNMRPDDNVFFPVGVEGDIAVTADQGTILMVGGEEKRSERTWGYGHNFVQVGHGGWDVDSRTDGFQGDIAVSAGQGIGALEGSIIARTGRPYESFAMIGHGGYASHMIVTGDGATDGMVIDTSSLINVTARDHIEFTGRKAMPTDAATLSAEFYRKNSLNEEINRYIGAPGGGAIDADTRPQIANRGTTWDIDRSFAKIGHGGYDWAADNGVNLSVNNTIDVTSGTGGAGHIRFTAGEGSQAFVQIGMGGREDAEDHDIVGADITINAAGDVYFDASAGGIAEYNQFGVGGDINGRARTEWSKGHESFAMIGNGGYDLDGDFDGEISITTTNGGNLLMIGPDTNTQVFSVNGFVGRTVEGVSDSVAGIRQMTVGNLHALTALQEATMKQRSFQLFHGNNGAALSSGHVGNIVPNTVRIDIASGTDIGDYAGDGTIRVGNATGAIVGSIDYTTGLITMIHRAEGSDGSFDRNVDYQYDNSGATGGTGTGSATQAIGDETTFESDAAIRATQAYLGHGGLVAGSVSIVIDGDNNGNGRQVFRDLFGDGGLYNETNQRIGSVSYDTGRVIFDGVNTATADNSAAGSAGENILNVGTAGELRAPLNDRLNPDEVSADYQYTVGNSDRAFVQIGNGGYASQVGGRDSLGNTGEITVTVAGDLRMHGGAFERNYVQLGHGGQDTSGRHGFQGDPGAATAGGAWGSAPLTDTATMDLAGNRDGNITVAAGGIVELLSGRALGYFDNEQYSQLGHGGSNADGHHQGNIRVTAGEGNLSSAPGMLGDSIQLGGVVFTAGQARDAYTQLGHGGFGARSSRGNNDPGARGLTGSIDVLSQGDILFTSGTLLANRYDYDDGRIYSQLGHGGYDADVRHNGGTNLRGTGLGHSGDISVVSSAGSIMFQAGDQNVNAPGSASGLGGGFGAIHYTHLGHGGYSAQGDHSGNITVSAAQDVDFRGGANTYDDTTDKRNYAILGHGGDESEGYNGARDASDDPTETISVTATTGDVRFVAGSGRRNWVQLGNGGYSNNGDHVANIDVNAGGDVLFIAGQAPDVFQIRGETGTSVDRATFGFNSSGALGWTPLRRRDIRIEDTSNTAPGRPFTITVDGFDYFASGLTLIEADGDAANTTANIVAAATGNGFNAGDKVGEIDLRNGEVRFLADIDPNNTFAFTTNYNSSASGNPDSNTSLDSTATNPQLVQAIQGPGTVGNTMQLFAYSNNSLGGITDVDSELDAPFTSNVGIAAGSFKLTVPDGTVIVDNGSNLEVQTVGVGSTLTIGQTVGTIDVATGQVTMTTAVNPQGRVGAIVDYDLDRPVGADLSYAKLGNGGYTADHDEANTDKSNVGDINVVAGGDVRFHAGDGDDAFTQLGHGGYDTKGAHSGDITVTAGGGLEFLGGIGKDRTDGRAFAHLGHGGYESDGNHFGNITITTGIGWESSAPGLANIPTVDNGTKLGVLFRAGDRSDNQVQLGHGGRSARSGTSTVGFGLNGDIKVVSEGEINFIAGALTQDRYETDDARLYAQLGHGGYDSDPESDGGGAYTGVGHNGDIIVVSTHNSITFAGSDTTRTNHPSSGGGTVFAPEGGGRFHYALLGHGGYAANGDHNGNIFVSAGIAYDLLNDRPIFNAGTMSYTVNNALADVNVLGGRSTDDNSGDKNNFATIGHGGRSASGHMGLATDTTTVMAGQDVNVLAGAGDYNYASIGNGGAAGRGDHQGNVQVYAERDVNVVGNNYTGGDIFQSIQGTGTANASWDRASNLGTSTQTPTDGAGVVRLDSAIRYTNDTMVIEVRDDAGNLIGTISDSMGDNRLYFTSDVTADFGSGVITIASTTPVGTVINSSRIRFDVDVNPGADGGPANLTAAYRHNDVDQAYAMIGHGGYDTDNNNDDVTAVRPGHVGNISVTARTGDINVLAGGDAATFAQIGNGGWETVGSHQGDIHVRAGGDLVATGSAGGQGWQSNSQIGHGGNMSNIADDVSPVGNYSGLIKVSAGTGELANSVDLGTTGKFNDVGDFDGDGTADTILFATTAGDGSITLTGGVTTQGYVQIGHGGHDADGDHDGIISVSAHRDITVAGGPSGNETSAQIGHGGTRSNGNLSGDISVLSNIGKLTVDAGGGTERYALIGHGDDRTTDTSNSTGSRIGDIFVLVNNWETLPSGNNFAGIGHRGSDANNGIAAGTVNFNIFSTGTQTIGANSETFIETMLNSGVDVTLAAQNLILGSGAEIFYNSAAEFNLLATQNVTFLDDVQNEGAGDINIVAGWDMMTGVTPGVDGMGQPSFLPTGQVNHIACAPNLSFNFDDIKDGAALTKAAFGNNSGLVVIGDGTQTIPVTVGSRTGATSVLGYGLSMTGGTTNSDGAQLGFYATAGTPITGAINVDVKEGGVDMNNGTATGTYTQIGHGGRNSTADVTIDAPITISFCAPGAASLQAGGNDSYSQIGHGGVDYAAAALGGTITIDGAGSLEVLAGTGTDGYAQIGHGGEDSSSTAALDDDDIVIDVFGDIDLVGGDTGTWTYAKIGHGGSNTTATNVTNSDILINTSTAAGIGAGALTLDANGASNAFVQIGHGGSRVDSDRVFATYSGDITVGIASSLTMTSGDETDTYTQIGHGGEGGGNAVPGALGDYSGTISVNTSGAATLQAGIGGDSYSQIGHGGDNAEAETDGDIILSAASIDVVGGDGVDAYAQIGNGGHGNDGNHSGDITLEATSGTFTVLGGGGENAYAQVGHGGNDEAGDDSGDDDAVNTLSGDIYVNVNPTTFAPAFGSGDLIVAGGTAADAYAQIGHGGDGGRSNTDGDVIVFSGGNIAVSAGDSDNTYAQIGHGGRDNDGNHGNNDAILVAALNGVDLIGSDTGSNSYAQIGVGGADADGTLSADVFVNFNPLTTAQAGVGAVTLTSGIGPGSYTQIGNGGSGADGSKSGETVVFGDSVAVIAGTDANAYSQIGSGGAGGSGAISGDVTVVVNGAAGSGDIVVSASGASAQIGSGGTDYNGGINGDIVATTENGDIIVDASTALADAIAQIGHGGFGSSGGAISGSIMVATTMNSNITDDAVILIGGGNAGTAARIGHGGANASNSLSGAVMVTADTDVELISGTGDGALTQIGHGGTGASGNRTGSIDVNSGGSVSLTGNGVNASARIGHGGRNALASSSGDVTVTSTSADPGNGSINLTGGTNDGASAQIGNGGFNSGALGSTTGNVKVVAPVDVNVTSGTDEGANAHIGLGGETSRATLGSASQVTTVIAGGTVNVDASAANDLAYAQIGNGGRDASGANQGNTVVDAGTDINVEAGTGLFSYAQIGLGGAGADGSKIGDVTATAGNNVNLNRGTGISAYAKIGNGDQLFSQPLNFGGSGNVSGDVTVTALDTLTSNGGMIGNVDPTLGGGTATGGDTTIAVSRFVAIDGEGASNRDPGTGLMSDAPGGGDLITDADAVFASAPSGELRFYIPSRSDNQIAAGAELNGVVFGGANADPTQQASNEFVVVRFPPGGGVPVMEMQHDNTVGSGAANYDVASGFSFYYDAIVGREQSFVAPSVGGGGGAAGGGGGGGASGVPAPVPFFRASTAGGDPVVVPVDPFLVFVNGLPFFGSDRLFDGSGRTFVGFFLFGLIDDRFTNEDNRDEGDILDEEEERSEGRGSAFKFDYEQGHRPGVSSYDVFGDASEAIVNADYFE